MLWQNESLDVMARLRSRIQRLLDEFGEQEESWQQGAWSPPTDILVDDDKVVLTMEVPGLTRERLAATVDGQTLTVSGERQVSGEAEGHQVRSERPRGKFRRSFALPWALDAERVEAKLEKGVLTIVVPRAEVQRIVVEEESE